MANEGLIKVMLTKWRDNPIIKSMREANKYYAVENETIQAKTRDYKDSNGNLVSNDSISNVKIPAAFLRMSVDQKVDYAFGKPFMISINKKDEKISDTIKDGYQKEWENFITPTNREQILEIARNAVNCGIGWCYPEIENGHFKISSVESDTLYPRWADKTHSELLSIVRDYIEEVYTEDDVNTVNKVEYWDAQNVEKYTCDDLTLTAEGDPTAHLIFDYSEQDNNEVNVQNEGWGKVPFIPLKCCRDEMPLLKLIRHQIDAYDELQSKSVDSLVDDIDPVLLLKGMSSEIKDLTEARMLIKNVRIASVDSDGDARYIQVNPNITATEQKLDNLEKDIKEFSCTVNTQDIEFGSNPSGVALKAAYQDLDVYTNKLELQFEVFIEKLKYFFDKYLVSQNKFNAEDLENLSVIVTLDRDMMINETELIENTSKLSGLVSQETLDNYNPAVESHEVEQSRREQEIDEQNNKDENDLFNFPDGEESEENAEEQPNQEFNQELSQ